MMEEFIKEYKHFAKQMFIISIICWVVSLIFILFIPEKKLLDDLSWCIVPIGAVIFTLIYINCKKNIKKYEEINNK